MTALLLLTLLLTLLSLVSSAYIIIRTVLPLVPTHVLTRCVPPSVFGLPSPPARLTPFGSARLFLAAADILALGLFLGQSILNEQLGLTGVEPTAGNVGRLWLALSARPTVLLFITFLAVIAARNGHEPTFGRHGLLLWVPALLLAAGTTLIMGLVSAHLQPAVFMSSLLGYTGTLTTLSSICFTAYLLSPLLAAAPSPTATWPANDDGHTIVRSANDTPLSLALGADPADDDEAEQIRALRRSESWLTSDAGSHRTRISVGSWDFTDDGSTRGGATTPSVRTGRTGRSASRSRASSFKAAHPDLRVPPPLPSASSATIVGSGSALSSPAFPDTPTSSDALIRAIDRTGSGLAGYRANRQDAAEKGTIRFGGITDAQRVVGSGLMKYAAWALYVWLPFMFTLPYLIHGRTTPHVPYADQVLLSLSITLSSPLLSCILLYSSLTSAPDTDTHPGNILPPSLTSAESLQEVISERAAHPTRSTMSQRTWRDTGMAVGALAPWQRAANFLRPSPKLAITPQQISRPLPIPEKQQQQPDTDENEMVEVDLHDGQPTSTRNSTPAASVSRKATFSWRDPTHPSPRNSATTYASTIGRRDSQLRPEESFHAQILHVHRLSSSAATVLSLASLPPPPPTPTSVMQTPPPPRTSMESTVSDNGSRRARARTPPPKTPPPCMPLPPLPPLTPKQRKSKSKDKSRPRSASMSAATSTPTPSTPAASASKDDITQLDTPGAAMPIRIVSQPLHYAPRTHRTANSTGSLDSITRAGLEGANANMGRMDSMASETHGKVRRVVNASVDEYPPAGFDFTVGMSSARAASQVHHRRKSSGSHYESDVPSPAHIRNIPSLHMSNKGSQSAARWSEDLEKALEDARAAEVLRRLKHTHTRAGSKSTLASVEEEHELLRAHAPTPPLSIRKHQHRTPSPAPTPAPLRLTDLGALNVEAALPTPDALPRASFIVHGQTPLFASRPGPAATQFTPSGPSVKAFHLPRKRPATTVPGPVQPAVPSLSNLPNVPVRSAAPRPPSRAGPVYLSSGQATPSNTPAEKPMHPLRLLALRQALYKDGTVVRTTTTGSAAASAASARRPLSMVVEGQPKPQPGKPGNAADPAPADHAGNKTPIGTDGVGFHSAEFVSTPITGTPRARENASRRMLRLVGSAASFASNRSRSMTLDSIGPLRN